MLLTYDAVDHAGRPSSDTVEATDQREALDILRNRGLYVTRIAPASGRGRSAAAAAEIDASVKLPLKLVAVFTRQMAMLLRAGSGVVPALAAVRKQLKKPAHAAVFDRIIADLQDGLPLTEALRKYPRTFSPVYCAIVAAGEASGTLNEMFDRLADMVGKQRAMRNKVIAAVAYPALLIVMCSQILLALLFFVIPRFHDMFTQLGVTPPSATRALLSIGAALRTYWPAALGIGIGTAIGATYGLLSERGRRWLADVQLSIPLVGKLRASLIQAQVFRTMGTLLSGGVGILDTLELVGRSTLNRRFQKLFEDIEDQVTRGGSVSTAFEQSGLVEPYVCQALRTGEDSGEMGGALTYCADLLDETNAELLNTLTRLIEPVILIVMGLLVGAVAIALFLPLFDLTAAVQ